MAVGLLDEMLESCILPFESALAESEASPVTPERVEELFAAATVVTDMLHVLHRKLKDRMSAGIEGRALAIHLQQHAEHIQKCLTIQAKARQLLRSGDATAELREPKLAMLEDMHVGTAKLRGEIDELLRWLASPPPKLDLTKLPGADRTSALEGFEALDDVINLLRTDSH